MHYCCSVGGERHIMLHSERQHTLRTLHGARVFGVCVWWQDVTVWGWGVGVLSLVLFLLGQCGNLDLDVVTTWRPRSGCDYVEAA